MSLHPEKFLFFDLVALFGATFLHVSGATKPLETGVCLFPFLPRLRFPLEDWVEWRTAEGRKMGKLSPKD